MNRAERRGQAHGVGTPVTVTREVPVTVLAGGDGPPRLVNHDTDEPCYACPCCALWARTLDTLAGAIREHEHGAHHGTPPEAMPGCLVCQVLAGAADKGQ